jgi:hypothetical protein
MRRRLYPPVGMRRWGLLLLFCCVGLAVAGAPPEAWFGRSSAMILLPPGATRIDAGCGPLGPTARVERIVTPRIGVAASTGTVEPFGLGVKVVLVEELVPLFVAATLGTDGIGVVSTLFFGPVRIDGGRTWGEAADRWGSVQLAANPHLSMLVGVERRGDRVGPYAGVRLFPGGHGLWEIGVSVRFDGIRLSVGGASW